MPIRQVQYMCKKIPRYNMPHFKMFQKIKCDAPSENPGCLEVINRQC